MKKNVFLYCSLALVSLAACNGPKDEKALYKGSMPIPKIIFDTDMGPDYDDIGAIAVLHALADSGECEVIATVASDAHPSIAPTIEVFNRYFGRPDIPVGRAVSGAPDFTAENGWNDSLINNYGKDLAGKIYEDAVSVYRKVLAAQPDNSVTVVTVGFLSNIDALLASPADDISSLSGIDLVKAKVNKLVAMAGAFPEGSEFNVNRHPESSVNAFSKWPKPILFSGFEIGAKIMTGDKVAARGHGDPVSDGYIHNLETYEKKVVDKRNSWDQTAVLVAVRDPENYFYVNGPGKFVVDSKGANVWNDGKDGEHYFLVHKYPYKRIENILEGLMLHQPKGE